MTEDQLEQETLAWLKDAGYTVLHGSDIAPDGGNPEARITGRWCWWNACAPQSAG